MRPEDVWMSYIRDVFPHRHSQAYFLPPIIFRKVPFSNQQIACEPVMVKNQQPPEPPPKPKHRKRGQAEAEAAPPVKVAGAMFTTVQHAQFVDQSDVQGEKAQEKAVKSMQALDAASKKDVMVVISQLNFLKYLNADNIPDPAEKAEAQAAIASLPCFKTAERVSRECDLVFLHYTHGVVVGEVKSVGGNEHFQKNVDKQNGWIVKEVKEAVKQVNNQAGTLTKLVEDLGLRVLKVLIFPNITSEQLTRALQGTDHAEDVEVGFAIFHS
jgi:hypothetical protein